MTIESNQQEFLTKARDYFLHIEAASPTMDTNSALELNEVDTFLAAYEEGFLADANYYQNRSEQLVRFSQSGTFLSKERPINRFQIQTKPDDLFFWGIEMSLNQNKQKNIWIPKSAAFVKMSFKDESLEWLKQRWVADNNFSHPYRDQGSSSYYDTNAFIDGIYDKVAIDLSEQGLITEASRMSYSPITEATITQSVSLTRAKYSGQRSNPNPDQTLSALKMILSVLPIQQLREPEKS